MIFSNVWRPCRRRFKGLIKLRRRFMVFSKAVSSWKTRMDKLRLVNQAKHNSSNRSKSQSSSKTKTRSTQCRMLRGPLLSCSTFRMGCRRMKDLNSSSFEAFSSFMTHTAFLSYLMLIFMSFKIFHISTFDFDYRGSFDQWEVWILYLGRLDFIKICWSFGLDMCNWILNWIKSTSSFSLLNQSHCFKALMSSSACERCISVTAFPSSNYCLVINDNLQSLSPMQISETGYRFVRCLPRVRITLMLCTFNEAVSWKQWWKGVISSMFHHLATPHQHWPRRQWRL